MAQSQIIVEDNNVIFCGLCGFGGLTFFHLLRHFRSHPGSSFRCGIEDCDSRYSNLSSFRAHLARKHEEVYPIIRAELPSLTNSCFSYHFSENDQLQPFESEPIDAEDLEISNAALNNLDSDDQMLDENTRKFAEILLVQGCSHFYTRH